MKSPLVLPGLSAVALCLGLLSYMGCQDAKDTASYREYSDLKNGGHRAPADKKNPPAANTTVSETPPPAVAEKPIQPAIAQAGPKRSAESQTEPVSVNRAETSPAESTPEETLAKSESPPREIKLLVPEKRFSKASADGTLRVSYDDLDLLRILNMDPVPLDVTDYLPDWLEQLEGKRIQIRGFMYPQFQETGLRGFVLARDNEICCFGRDPKVYDLIEVRMREGTTTDYLPNRPFDVVGTFHILPPEPDEKVLFRLYEIRDAAVINGRSR